MDESYYTGNNGGDISGETFAQVLPPRRVVNPSSPRCRRPPLNTHNHPQQRPRDSTTYTRLPRSTTHHRPHAVPPSHPPKLGHPFPHFAVQRPSTSRVHLQHKTRVGGCTGRRTRPAGKRWRLDEHLVTGTE